MNRSVPRVARILRLSIAFLVVGIAFCSSLLSLPLVSSRVHAASAAHSSVKRAVTAPVVGGPADQSQSPDTALTTVDLDTSSSWTYKMQSASSWTAITMPNQMSMSGLSDQWIDYQTTITIPNLVSTQVTKLKLLSINDGGTVLINATAVKTINYNIFPAEVDLSGYVVPGGTYTLTLRCYHRSTYYASSGYVFPQGHNYNEEVGVPRGVYLEVFPQLHITDTFVRPSVQSNNFSYDVWVYNGSSSAQNVTVRANLSSWNGSSWSYPTIPDQNATLAANAITKVAVGPISWGLGTSSYWWPNIPYDPNYVAQLHNLNISLIQGTTTWDTHTQRFGFASYTEGPDYYMINGVRITEFLDSSQEPLFMPDGKDGFQVAYTTLQGFLPGTSGAATTFGNYMKIGINGIRIHNSALTSYLFNVADELGFMLIPESAIRGFTGANGSSGTVWDPTYYPASIQAEVDYSRTHPSVVRYSLSNEFTDGESNSSDVSAMIDTAAQEDATRPLTFSSFASASGTLYDASHTYHANIITHYHTPPSNPNQITGEEEYAWNTIKPPNPSKHNEMVTVAQHAILDRLANLAVDGPWCWNNYWSNFVAGASEAAGTYRPMDNGDVHGDRSDGVDGWGSNIINFVQNSYSPYAAADIDMYKNHIGTEQNIFTNVPTYPSGGAVQRQIALFNGTLTNQTEQVAWEVHWDSPTGTLIASGTTSQVQLSPGTNTTQNVGFTLPTTASNRSVYFVLHTLVNGTQQFTENRYTFNVTAADLAQSATITATSVSSQYGTLYSAQNPTFPQSITLSWSSQESFDQVALQCWYCQGQGLTNVAIQVSPDGSNWTTVATATGITYAHNDTTVETRSIGFPAVFNQVGLRIVINGANLQWGHYGVYAISVPALTNLESTASVSASSVSSQYGPFASAQNPTLPQSITLSWSSPQSFDQVAIQCWYCQGQGLTSVALQVSPDGSNWNTVATNTSLSYSHNDTTVETRTFSFPAVFNQLGLRLVINGANLQWGHYSIYGFIVPALIDQGADASISSTSVSSQYGVLYSAQNPGFPQTVTLSWDSSRSFNTVAIQCAYCQGQGLTNFTIQVSPDGSNWTTVATATNLSYSHNDTTTETQEFTFSTVTNQLGLRLVITGANLQWGHYGVNAIVVPV